MRGNEGTATLILKLSSRWRWVASFIPRPLYPKGKSSKLALDMRLDGPRNSLDVVEKSKITFPCQLRWLNIISQYRDHQLDNWWSGVWYSARASNFSIVHSIQSENGALWASYLVEMWPLFQGIKWLGTKTDRSPPCNAEFKNIWSCTSTSLDSFMVRYITKHRNNFAITLTSWLGSRTNNYNV
jgi:hypothetical protein